MDRSTVDTMSVAPKDVFGHGTEEDLTLEHLGYQQGMTGIAVNFRSIVYLLTLLSLEFKRSFGLLDMIGFSFSIVTWLSTPTLLCRTID